MKSHCTFKTLAIVAAAAAQLFLGHSRAGASDYVYWNKAGGGDFLTPGNWSLDSPYNPGGVNPESIVDGSLNFSFWQPSPRTVTLSRDTAVCPLVVKNDGVTFDLGGHQLTTPKLTVDGSEWYYSVRSR